MDLIKIAEDHVNPRRGAGVFWVLIALILLVVFSVISFASEGEVPRPGREAVRSQLRRAPRLGGPRAAAQDAFQVRYTLPQDADLSVTLLDLRRIPLRTFQVAAGEPGAQAGENVLTLWDGKDLEGQEAPAGEYWAALSFRFPDGSVENKRFRVVKP